MRFFLKLKHLRHVYRFLLQNCGTQLPVRDPGPLTVFVPTNKAIDRFRDGSIIYMLSDVSVHYLLLSHVNLCWTVIYLFIPIFQARPKLQMLLKHHMFSLAAVSSSLKCFF